MDSIWKYIAAIFTGILALLGMGCSNLESVDPVETGEVIGFVYTMTKDELDEDHREAVEEAYAVFVEVVNNFDENGNIDLKQTLFNVLEEKFPGETGDNAQTKAIVKMIVNRYWDRVDEKYGITNRIPSEQIAIVRQVYIGIERGLGREVE
jgi:hypothetical protein